MVSNEKEIYEIEEDTVENFDTLNEIYRNTTSWMITAPLDDNVSIIKDDNDPLNAFKSLMTPSLQDETTVTYTSEYIPGESDPYERLLNLKRELIDVSEDLNHYTEKFKDNKFIQETENLNDILQELKDFKDKVDVLLDYDVLNNMDEEDDHSNEDNNNSINKKDLENNYTKYQRIADNLTSLLNLNNTESISSVLMKLLNFISVKMNEKYDRRYQALKECGTIITRFIDTKKDKIENGSYFMKIKELSEILELQENFETSIDYLKKRLAAIKEIHEKSDQFTSLIEILKNLIKDNEDKFNNLMISFNDALKSFEEYNECITQLTLIQLEIDKFLI